MSDWLNAITAIRREQSETPAPGFKTREQIQKDLGTGSARTGEMIRQAVRLGLAECRKFKIATGAGVRPVPHYRLLTAKIGQIARKI